MLEAGSNRRFAPCLDRARAVEQTLLAKLGIAHALAISPEVIRFDTKGSSQIRLARGECAQFGDFGIYAATV